MKDEKSQYSRAAAAILSSPSMEKAAKSLKISPSTLWRWMQEPEMQVELVEARRRLLSCGMESPELGEWMRFHRSRAGWSWNKLARYSGVSHQAI